MQIPLPPVNRGLKEAVPPLHQEDGALIALGEAFASVHVVWVHGQVALHGVNSGGVEGSTHTGHLQEPSGVWSVCHPDPI